MPTIEIKRWNNGEIIWGGEAETIADAVRFALKAKANLSWANLSEANLSWANLDRIKKDFFAVLAAAPLEVSGLMAALEQGRIDGSCYEGECACLIGTIANVRGCEWNDTGVIPDSGRPAERWFMALRPGNTPSNHPVAKITAGWIEEFQIQNVSASNTPAQSISDL